MSVAAAGLIGGFAQGFSTRRDMRERDIEREERDADRALRREELDIRREALNAGVGVYDPSEVTGPIGQGIFPEGGGRRGRRRRGVDGGRYEPYRTGDPVAEDMEPYQRAFLNTIAGGESGGAYNVRYTPGGAATFDSFDAHPRIFEEGPHGPSSAAGRYQFTASTWDDLGGGDFSPRNQDTRAWTLAEQRYRASTGRDLGADLQARGLTGDMLETLTPTWQAFGSGRNRHIATYNDSLARYGRTEARPAPVQRSAAPAVQDWGVLRRLTNA